MKITKVELIGMQACEEGLARFIKQTGNTDEPVEVAGLIGGENTYGDLLWLASRKLPKERIVRFACDCALLNVELIKPYTDKYESIVKFLRNPTAAEAANICAAADDATRAAAHAADTTADATACVAAAACAAARAAVGHARAAVTHATNAGGEERINELLKELFA